jgi:predicted  nucleic acid-binding Zn-ribbon protein
MFAAMIMAAAIVVWAMWPKQKDDFTHLLKSFQAQQESIQKTTAELKTLSNLWADNAEQVSSMRKKIEWLEIKINSKNEVAKYALPQEMRVIIEKRILAKKPLPSGVTSPTPDYAARG